MPHVGVDVGGTNIKIGVTGANGRLLQERAETLPHRGSEAVVAAMLAGIDALLSKASLDCGNVESIGVVVPGTTDSERGLVVYAPNLFWRDVAIVDLIRARYRVPIHLTQDTRAAAWAEYLVGAGQGLRGVASLTLGTGIGCGLIIDGRIFHGALNTAGEFGHQIVEPGGNLCNCGRRGCLEAYAGGLAIVSEAKRRIPDIHEILHKSSSDIDVQDVFLLAEEQNESASAVVERAVRYIGMGLVNLINLCSVEMVAISGGISNAPRNLLLDRLVDFVRDNAYVTIARGVRICQSALGENAPLIGASLLYRESANGKSLESIDIL